MRLIGLFQMDSCFFFPVIAPGFFCIVEHLRSPKTVAMTGLPSPSILRGQPGDEVTHVPFELVGIG